MFIKHLVETRHQVGTENTMITTLSPKQFLGQWGDRSK